MLTFLPLDEIEKMENLKGAELNQAKEILAYELTSLVHGADEAQKAQASAKALFVQGGDDSNMPTTKIETNENEVNIIDILVQCKLTQSKGEARRLIQQGGVSVDEEKINSIDYKVPIEKLKEGIKIKKGKKIFHKAII